MLRKAFITSLVVSIAAVFASSSQASEFDLRIAGTAGTKFSGQYILIAQDGDTRSQQLEGTVPLRLRLEGRSIVIRLNKWAAGGRLKVALYRDGKSAGQGMTTGANGYVTVSAGEPGFGFANLDDYGVHYRYGWSGGQGGG